MYIHVVYRLDFRFANLIETPNCINVNLTYIQVQYTRTNSFILQRGIIYEHYEAQGRSYTCNSKPTTLAELKCLVSSLVPISIPHIYHTQCLYIHASHIQIIIMLCRVHKAPYYIKVGVFVLTIRFNLDTNFEPFGVCIRRRAVVHASHSFG